MIYHRKSGAQIAPCHVSKIRYDFGLSSTSNNHHPPCSKEYWDEAVEIIANQHNITDNEKIEQVKGRFASWF